jgi:hypothetical protein
MCTHNDIEIFQAGEASQDFDSRIQIQARKFESQNIHFAYRVVQSGWDHSLKMSLEMNNIMHLGMLNAEVIK